MGLPNTNSTYQQQSSINPRVVFNEFSTKMMGPKLGVILGIIVVKRAVAETRRNSRGFRSVAATLGLAFAAYARPFSCNDLDTCAKTSSTYWQFNSDVSLVNKPNNFSIGVIGSHSGLPWKNTLKSRSVRIIASVLTYATNLIFDAC